MKTATRSVLAAVLVLVVVGCGGGGTPPIPTSGSSPTPTGAGGSAGTPVMRTVRIVSGVDGAPVAGAAVAFENADSPDRSGPGGEVSPTDYIYSTYGVPPGTGVDVDARGFLPRRTRIERGGVVTLWPVADGAEADAVRRMVYGDQEIRQPFDLGPILLSVLLEGFWGSEAGQTWKAEALAFGARVGLGYEWSTFFQYETNEVAVRFDTVGQCAFGPGWGFCREPSPYFASFVVRPERAGDPATIRRVLASVFLGPNPLPGLLNPDEPTEELSPLEEQTIRMILLRRLPNRWPDNDR